MKPLVRSVCSGLTLTSALYVLALGGSETAQDKATPPTPEQVAFFESKVRPVLADNCFSCHGKDVQMAGLRVDSREGLLKGGDSGAAIVAGEPEKSLLVRAVHQTGALKMPKGKKLAAGEIADIEAWIKMGAPWPATTVKVSERPPLWSLKPVKKPASPKVKNAAWVKNPIDAFILAGLEAKKLSPAAPADRRTLIRRLSYDLTGLPPSAEEIDAFVADKSPTAYEKVVDRLLASPRYGERQARLWLDVARYADTKGYVFEEDRNYYNAYTYRDWVIDAFNKDLPYDQFIVQQLAADRLPNIEENRKPLAALGFLTVGRRFLNQTPDIIDDRIDVTMRGFQGFTVACARCHDHKFDPVPTQDYYSLYAIFNSSEETTVAISDKAIREPWEKHNQRVAATENEIRTLILTQVKKLREKAKTEGALQPEVKNALQALREDQVPDKPRLDMLAPAFEPAEREKLSSETKELADLRAKAPQTPDLAMAMKDKANPGDGYVFRRGNPGASAGPAPRRFLAALSKPGAEREHWKNGSGRLELANAIASTENPLTARVLVNRVWMHHFGNAIVRTPSDFGYQGEKPTHPELLDYLAATFVESGWSIKKLHRLILTSATYRQSSAVSQAVFNKDPENRTWSRMNRRRLDLEQTRDALMLASGQLDVSATGGKSVDLWAQPFAKRRAVYGFIERQNLPGIFRTFDFASPDSTSPRRFMTTVPQQALFFMNSPFSVSQARAVADRNDIQSAKDSAQQVRRLYRLLFGRLPDPAETAAGVAYLKLGEVEAPPPIWQYGYGEFDALRGVVATFTPLPHFGAQGYQGGQAFPDPQLSYLLLNSQGGHPGQNAARAAIRRWVAPAAMTIGIDASLHHPQRQGDGVRARIVSSRSGPLGEWKAHNNRLKTDLSAVTVERGEKIDFIVDPVGSHDFDGFSWNVTIRAADGSQAWNSVRGFGPPAGPAVTRLALYAQALMMTNEFLFVD